MPRPALRKWWLIALALAAGAALRLWFIHAYPEVDGDPLVYGDIAKNWMLHSIYGRTIAGHIVPTLIRLPGYPLFLVLCFRLFGLEHYNAVMYTQVAIDLATCLLIAALACRIWSPARRLVGSLARRPLPLYRQLHRHAAHRDPRTLHHRSRLLRLRPCSRRAPLALGSHPRLCLELRRHPSPRWRPARRRPLPRPRLLRIEALGHPAHDPLGSSSAVSSPSSPSSPGPSATPAPSTSSSPSPRATPLTPAKTPTPASSAGHEPSASTSPAPGKSTGMPTTTSSTSAISPHAPSTPTGNTSKLAPSSTTTTATPPSRHRSMPASPPSPPSASTTTPSATT